MDEFWPTFLAYWSLAVGVPAVRLVAQARLAAYRAAPPWRRGSSWWPGWWSPGCASGGVLLLFSLGYVVAEAHGLVAPRGTLYSHGPR